MYYRRVNRGLSFTKPGMYAFALVLLLGLLAVASGINGLYLFLSAGLGGFIVSGLLSERAMKSCTVRAVGAALVDAEAAFPLTFEIENASSWFSVFAIENLFLSEKPPFRLVAQRPKAVARVRLTQLLPKSVGTFTCTARGLPRGEVRRALVMQLTTFPFGILEKFKLVEVAASILVAPAIDAGYLRELRELLRAERLKAGEEFFSHRPYRHDDPRQIDWRKSAAKPLADWVVKVRATPREAATVIVDADWSYVASLTSAAAYEGYLRRVRTALKAVEEAGLEGRLDLGAGIVLAGHDRCLAALAALPAYSERHSGPGPRAQPGAPRQEAGETQRLVVRLAPDATVGVDAARGEQPARMVN